MTDVLRELSRKMDEMVGRQERTMGLISVQGGVQPQQGGQQGGAALPLDFARKQDVDMLIQSYNRLLETVREVQ